MSKESQFIGSADELAKKAEKFEKLQKDITKNEEDFLDISERVLKKFNQRLESAQKSYDLSKEVAKQSEISVTKQREQFDLAEKARDAYYKERTEEQDATKDLIKKRQLELDATNDQIEALKKSIALAEKKNDTMNMSLLDRQISGLREQAKLERQMRNDLRERLELQKDSMNVGLEPLIAKRNEEEKTLQNLEQQAVESKKSYESNFVNLKKLKDINLILGRNADAIRNIGLLGKLATSPWLLLYFLIDTSVKRFAELDRAAEEYRKTTGFTLDQTVKLRENVEAVNRSSMQYGVTIEKAYVAAKALSDTFQTIGAVSEDNVQFVALMKENIGVAVEDSAKVLQNFMGLGGTTESVAKDSIRIGAVLSKNLGVSFAEVMKDVNNSSKEAVLMIGGSPAKLLKAAIQARMLGISLGTAAKNARGLLNFDESINNELEASVLLGKNINFMNARRLAFEGDIVGSQKEALEVVKQSGDFNKMNVLQREALAKAAGIEVEDLSKMLAQEKVRADVTKELEKDTTKSGQARLQAYKDSLNVVKDTTDELFKQELASAKNVEKNRQMQGVMTDINNLVDEMKQLFSEILLPFIGPIISLLVPALKIVGGILRGLISGFITPIKEALAPIVDNFKNLTEGTELWGEFLETIPKVFGIIGSLIGGIIAMSIKFGTLITDILGTLAGTIVNIFEEGPMAIVDGLSAVSELIVDALMTPFKSVWNYLKETFLGNSPSELGLMMVDGLSSVGGMIVDALTSPFKIVWDYISSIFSGDGQFVSMIKNVGGFIVDLMLSPIKSTMSLIKGFTDAVGITKAEPVKTPSNGSSSSNTSSESVDTVGVEQRLDKLISVMSETNALLKSGAISVYLDGKKVSREIALSIS